LHYYFFLGKLVDSKIDYKGGYKYQLKKEYKVDTPIKPKTKKVSQFITLDITGGLTIKAGYAWDGPSGPTFDTKSFMRGSLVHDALYQLMREGLLCKEFHRKISDLLLQVHCKEDGMSSIRAWWVYFGVRLGGNSSASS